MGWLTTTVRRSLWIVLIAAAGGAVWSWRRDAADSSTPAPAEWPPLSTPRAAPATSSTTASSNTTSGGHSASDNSAAPIVNALGDAPEARSANGSSGGWSEPLADGSCPVGFPVKANDNSGIFHIPGGRFYDRTKPERCYSDPEAAIADGYRRAKN